MRYHFDDVLVGLGRQEWGAAAVPANFFHSLTITHFLPLTNCARNSAGEREPDIQFGGDSVRKKFASSEGQTLAFPSPVPWWKQAEVCWCLFLLSQYQIGMECDNTILLGPYFFTDHSKQSQISVCSTKHVSQSLSFPIQPPPFVLRLAPLCRRSFLWFSKQLFSGRMNVFAFTAALRIASLSPLCLSRLLKSQSHC